ncbi:nSTAND1 domain-containing NTPase [Streptomyces sp. NPDC001348]
MRLEEKIAEFERRHAFGKDLTAYLRHNRIKVVRVEQGQQGRWSLFTVLPDPTAEMFDIDRELLFLATDYEAVEPRILSDLQSQMRKNARVEDEIAVLISKDSNARRLVRMRAGEAAILTIDGRNLPRDVPDFRVIVSEMLESVDHFNVTTPITSPSAFFGRQRDISSVRRYLDQGQHVGIFGLRKAGKSSLLNRVSVIERERGSIVVNLDLNEYFGTPRRFRAGVVRALSEELAKSHVTVPRLRSLRPSHGRDDFINEYWMSDLDALLNAVPLSRNVILVIDEIDSALPSRILSRAEADEEVGLLRALSQLRAFIQKRQSRGQLPPVILSAGVDPSLFERASVRGITNPLFQFSALKFIEPMDRDELQDMIRTLGKRTGLKFRSHEVIDELMEEYGGHPLLTRQACSYVHRHRPKGVVPHQVQKSDVQKAFAAKGPGSPLEHARAIPESFSEWFPEESELLRERWSSAQFGPVDTSGLEHAISYGLIHEDGSVRMRALTRTR